MTRRIFSVLVLVAVALALCMGGVAAQDSGENATVENDSSVDDQTPTGDEEAAQDDDSDDTDDTEDTNEDTMDDTDSTAEEEGDEPYVAAEKTTLSEEESAQYEGEVVKEISGLVDVANIEFKEDRVEVVVYSSRPTRVSFTDLSDLRNDRYSIETVTVARGYTRVTMYTAQRPNDLGIAQGGEGKVLTSPHASVFHRPTRWADHPLTAATAVGVVALAFLYRYRRTLYFEERDIRSLIDRRK